MTQQDSPKKTESPKNRTIDDVKIEKLIFGGQGLARTEHGAVFAWNALPGENVSVRVTKKRKGVLEGVATTFAAPSSDRMPPREDHFLSCSPWQILSPSAELQWKLAIARETYQKIGHIPEKSPLMQALGIATHGSEYRYRNKMEYSFVDTEAGVSLAFYDRGLHTRTPIDECLLATPEITKAATAIVGWLRDKKIVAQDLKSLILRSGDAGALSRTGETGDVKVIVGLFCTRDLKLDAQDVANQLQDVAGQKILHGLHIFYSRPEHPAASADKLLSSHGASSLRQTVGLAGNGGALTLEYGLLSFFQVNVPVFEKALADIIEQVPNDADVLDFYSGVGSIGIAVATKAKHVTLVDSDEQGIDFAKKNLATNVAHTNTTAATGAKVSALAASAESMTSLIHPEHTLIVDPPRIGLHNGVVQRILAVRPKRVVYLSCNLSTQARDIGALATAYTPVFARLYNFFPRTPHIEGLMVLDLAE